MVCCTEYRHIKVHNVFTHQPSVHQRYGHINCYTCPCPQNDIWSLAIATRSIGVLFTKFERMCSDSLHMCISTDVHCYTYVLNLVNKQLHYSITYEQIYIHYSITYEEIYSFLLCSTNRTVTTESTERIKLP